MTPQHFLNPHGNNPQCDAFGALWRISAGKERFGLATKSQQNTARFVEVVAANDSIDTHLDDTMRRIAAASKASLALAKQAAWLVGQISIQEVNLPEARAQFHTISNELVSLWHRFPDELGTHIKVVMGATQHALKSESLSEMANTARDIRNAMEQYHKASLS